MNGKNTLHIKLLDGRIQLSLGDQIGTYDSEGSLRSVVGLIGGAVFPGKVVLDDMRSKPECSEGDFHIKDGQIFIKDCFIQGVTNHTVRMNVAVNTDAAQSAEEKIRDVVSNYLTGEASEYEEQLVDELKALMGSSINAASNTAPETEMSEQTVKQIRELVNKTTKEAIRNEQRSGGTLWAMQRDGGSVLNCKLRFSDSKASPFGNFPHPKRSIALTVSGLEEWTDGILHGTTVQVSVYQGDKLLRSKVITGKTSGPFTQVFDVNASFDDLTVTHNRPDLPLLKVSAEFVK